MITEFLPMNMAEALHHMISTGLLHQMDTGETETGEVEVMDLKSTPWEYQKWTQGVRFTPGGSDRRSF